MRADMEASFVVVVTNKMGAWEARWFYTRGGWPRTKDGSGNKADQAFGAKFPPPAITIQLMVRWLYVSPNRLGLSNPRSLPT